MKTTQKIALLSALLPFTVGHAAEGFTLSSADLNANTSISPSQYWDNFGCTGSNERPRLKWSGAPDGTKSYAITFYDQDAPTGSGFWHWGVYNIPSSVNAVDGEALPEGAVESNTDMGEPGYLGPCPPVGRKHTYTYRVHALDVDILDVPVGATAALTGFFIYQHTMDTAALPVIAGPRVAE